MNRLGSGGSQCRGCGYRGECVCTRSCYLAHRVEGGVIELDQGREMSVPALARNN